MIEPEIPDDEEKRLALLAACKIMYTPQEAAFDDVARLAAEICGTEIALITLVDADYQWFKARVGVEIPGVARDLSFCGHCINHSHPFVVEDTHLDPRFADNPLVTGEPFIRFYAGVPFLVEEGSSIGALSVADRTPRTLSERHRQSLERLARRVSTELRLRMDVKRPPSPGPLVPEGARVGGYRVRRPLGRGASGEVFEAESAEGTRVAIKVLLPERRRSASLVERFVREARTLVRLESPHVGRLLGVGNLDTNEGALPYLVLEHLEGIDLGKLLEREGPRSYREAFAWCADACDGVAAAHARGIIHRDIKPSNVFLAKVGAGTVVKVLDFGIAVTESSPDVRLTDDERAAGSPAYMSPEQMLATSDVDVRSDVWSMGALLYELLTGALPFPGASELEIFANVMTKAPTPLAAHLSEVPEGIEPILSRCLARDREARYPSMPALASALRARLAA